VRCGTGGAAPRVTAVQCNAHGKFQRESGDGGAARRRMHANTTCRAGSGVKEP